MSAVRQHLKTTLTNQKGIPSMNKLFRLYAVGLTVAVLVALTVNFATGQVAGVIGQFTPFVIDVAQEVPVLVDAPVVLESGEIITATTPLTISVELRVRVDGPQQVVVEVLDAPEPVVALATATPMPVTTGQAGVNDDVIVGEVRWRVLAVEDVGDTLTSDNMFTEDMTTPGRFIRLQFEIENLSSAAKTFSSINLVDSQGRSFNTLPDGFWFVPQAEQCIGFDQLNPSVPKRCTVIFEVPTDADGLQAQVGDLELLGGDEALISLGL
jgi:hypothetical protein